MYCFWCQQPPTSIIVMWLVILRDVIQKNTYLLPGLSTPFLAANVISFHFLRTASHTLAEFFCLHPFYLHASRCDVTISATNIVKHHDTRLCYIVTIKWCGCGWFCFILISWKKFNRFEGHMKEYSNAKSFQPQSSRVLSEENTRKLL